MKKIVLILTSFFIVLLISGCGGVKTPEGTVKALLDGMKSGEVNEVAVKYSSNPSLLVSDSTTDTNGLRNAIFSRIEYKILNAKEYAGSKEEAEKEATIKLELKNIDVTAVTLYLKNDLLDKDEAYFSLAGEAKQSYYDTLQLSTIEETKDKNLFKTDQVEIDLIKENGKWKIQLSTEFLYSVLGMRY